MNTITFIKVYITLWFLIWYRKHFDLDNEDEMSELDITINNIIKRIEDVRTD